MAARAGLGYITPPKPSDNTCIISKGDTGAVESHRYYLARKTVLEMLRDRGCVVDDSEVERTLSEFRSVFGEKPDVDHWRVCVPLLSRPSKKVTFFLYLCFLVLPGGKNYARKRVVRLSQVDMDLARVGESQLISSEIVQETTKKIIQIKERLKTTKERQKSYADKRRKPFEFNVHDRVLLKVSLWKGVVRFDRKGKLTPREGGFQLLKFVESLSEDLNSHGSEKTNSKASTLISSQAPRQLTSPVELWGPEFP
nr:reverse transcriptase domain-containing protein [Tanacetum cinerariifolium]